MIDFCHIDLDSVGICTFDDIAIDTFLISESRTRMLTFILLEWKFLSLTFLGSLHLIQWWIWYYMFNIYMNELHMYVLFF